MPPMLEKMPPCDPDPLGKVAVPPIQCSLPVPVKLAMVCELLPESSEVTLTFASEPLVDIPVADTAGNSTVRSEMVEPGPWTNRTVEPELELVRTVCAGPAPTMLS